MKEKITVALVQQTASSDYTLNMDHSVAGIREAAAQGAEVVLLQELHGSFYFCQHQDPREFDRAEPIPGRSTERLGALAKELNIVIIASIFERRGSGIYHNTAVVLDNDGSIAGKYRKMHIPDDPGFMEKFYFTPGDLGFTPIDTSIGRLGVLVCWDQWFPEAARLMAIAGANLLLYPTAIGWDPHDDDTEKARQRDAWITIQRAHAIANGLPLLTCNRTGFEPHPTAKVGGIQFWGSSFICGPQGEILCQASIEKPDILVQEIHLKHSENVRRIWPFLRDRRIDSYKDLLKRLLK